jgi:hypothetical protein
MADALPEGTSVQYIIEFNFLLRKLTLELTRQFPHDPPTARAQKRIMLAINDFPEWTTKEVGKGLSKYARQINDEDVSFFLKSDYDEERQKAAEEDPEKAALTDHLIPKVKDAWQAADEGKRTELIELAQDLLDAYLNYAVLARAEERAREEAP